MPEDEIKEITVFRFAGSLYESREVAERARAMLDLREFATKDMELPGPETDRIAVRLSKSFEKYIGLLNKFY